MQVKEDMNLTSEVIVVRLMYECLCVHSLCWFDTVLL